MKSSLKQKRKDLEKVLKKEGKIAGIKEGKIELIADIDGLPFNVQSIIKYAEKNKNKKFEKLG